MGPHANLFLACLWILLSFMGGLALGLRFTDNEWLGGYGSLKRRMYRLAHISFFGLGTVNFIYYSIAERIAFGSTSLLIASWGFLIGAITMPICCVILAHRERWTSIFAIPVVSLITAGVITLWEVASV